MQVLGPADTRIMKILFDQKSVHVALRQRPCSPVLTFQDFSFCVCGACAFERESAAQFAGDVIDEGRYWEVGVDGER